MNESRTPPFLKWAGGKRWLVARHSDWLFSEADRYIEPFLGSGAVFFHLAPGKSILSDSNEELIETYSTIREDPEGVVRHLRKHQKLHSTSYYYAIRAIRPRTSITRAARFLYLNRTCFNGLYRVNLDGVFNVPQGTKSRVLLPTDNFVAASRILKAAKLLAKDFEQIVLKAREGDFLYIDPPYTVKHNNNNFLKYNERIFSWSDQVRLAGCALEAARRGARVLISNADHSSVRQLYKNSVWTQIRVERFSHLSSSADFRKCTTEIVVSNYMSETGQKVEPRT